MATRFFLVVPGIETPFPASTAAELVMTVAEHPDMTYELHRTSGPVNRVESLGSAMEVLAAAGFLSVLATHWADDPPDEREASDVMLAAMAGREFDVFAWCFNTQGVRCLQGPTHFSWAAEFAASGDFRWLDTLLAVPATDLRIASTGDGLCALAELVVAANTADAVSQRRRENLLDALRRFIAAGWNLQVEGECDAYAGKLIREMIESASEEGRGAADRMDPFVREIDAWEIRTQP